MTAKGDSFLKMTGAGLYTLILLLLTLFFFPPLSLREIVLLFTSFSLLQEGKSHEKLLPVHNVRDCLIFPNLSLVPNATLSYIP